MNMTDNSFKLVSIPSFSWSASIIKLNSDALLHWKHIYMQYSSVTGAFYICNYVINGQSGERNKNQTSSVQNHLVNDIFCVYHFTFLS